ncbi:MAG: hypothetical protein VX246_16955 [Myxococcota bacterium]|nr:hypothetical protein [Myxococcota bacterium]
MSRAQLADWGPPGLAVVLAAAAALWLAPFGLALSPDGAHYTNVALRLAYDGFAFVDPKYPVGYPLLLQLVMPFEPFPMDAAVWLSVLCFGVTLCGVGNLARRLTSQSAWAFAAVLACAFFIPIWNAHLLALSEAPFTSLLILHCVCVARHLELARNDSKAGLGWFALAAVCVGMSAVVRVMGYALIAAFSAYAFAWVLRGTHLARTRLKLLAAHSLSYLPALAIAIANAAAGSAVHGDRPPTRAAETFTVNVERVIATLGTDLGAALVATIAASLVAFFVHLQRQGTARGSTSTASLRAASLYLYLLTIVAVYVPVLIAGASLTKISPINTRFLMPIYPLLILLALGVARFAPTPLIKIGGFLSAVSFAHVVGLGLPELARRHAEFVVVAEQPRTLHLATGYDRSPSSRAVRDFIGELASATPRTTLSALFPMPRGGQHARLARALLFRSSSVPETAAPVDFEIEGADSFVMALGSNGSTLRYVDLAMTGQDARTPQTVLEAVLSVMVKYKRPEHWLLSASPGDPLQGTGELLSGPLVILEQRVVGGYNAYLFAPRSR